MLRGFRHTLFLLLQGGVVSSGLIALAIQPSAWTAIVVCVVGALLSSLICERISSRYLRSTLGSLRRAADDIGRGRMTTIETQPGADFYKLVNAINTVAVKLAETSAEEKRLQEELRRRERLAFLGELAASVAHEVNNPLDGLLNCSRILRRSLNDRPRAEQMLDLIDSGVNRIHLIVRRLLTLARENDVRLEECNLVDLVERAMQAAATRLDGRGIRVRRDFREDECRVGVDPALIEQVFVNLILNAIDSMPPGGELVLAVRRERLNPPVQNGDDSRNELVCIDVADSGSGIPADMLPHIFEPFFTTKKDGKGTGLGLAIASRIVDAHRGNILVSGREGGGTVFTVQLPAGESARVQGRSPDRSEEAAAASAHATGSGGANASP